MSFHTLSADCGSSRTGAIDPSATPELLQSCRSQSKKRISGAARERGVSVTSRSLGAFVSSDEARFPALESGRRISWSRISGTLEHDKYVAQANGRLKLKNRP